MSRVPEKPALPMNWQATLCEPCHARGFDRYCQVVMCRDLSEDFGTVLALCQACGWERFIGYVPLSFLSAQTVRSLHDAAREVGLPGMPESVGDLSPGALRMVETYSLNPLLLAEAAARFASEWQTAKRELAESRAELVTQEDER